MSTPNDGGPAFPCAAAGNEGQPNHLQEGMALRDWFAGQALAALVSRESSMDGCAQLAEVYKKSVAEVVAKATYEYADAMLAERAKKGAHE